MIVRATYLADIGGTLVDCGVHYRVEEDTGWTSASMSDLADKIDSSLTTAFRAMLPTTGTVNALKVREEVEHRGVDVPAQAIKTLALAGTLTASDTKLPKALCGVIKRTTAAAIRSGHSHIMAPPPLSSAQLGNGGTFTAGNAYPAALLAFAALLDDNLQHTTAGVNDWHLEPVVYSHTRRTRAITPYYFIVTGATHDLSVHWLRSRLTTP